MTWRQEQQAFWNWITHPQDLSASEHDINALFAPHSALSKVEALAIYNNAYHQRLMQISSELYPVLYHTLGDATYTRLWLDYIGRHPPRPGPMSMLGKELPGFVQAHPKFGQLPALHDIALLETLLIELFDQADTTPLSRRQLQDLPADQWPAQCWKPCPDWALISSAFDLEVYWANMQAYLKNKSAEAGKTDFAIHRHSNGETVHYLVRRVNHRMRFQRINQAMKSFLEAVQEGKNFAAICELLATQFPGQDIAELSLQLLLKSTDLGLLRT